MASGRETSSLLSFLRRWCLLIGIPCYLPQKRRQRWYLAYHVFVEVSFALLLVRMNGMYFAPWLTVSGIIEMISPTFFQVQETARLLLLYAEMRRFEDYLRATDDLFDDRDTFRLAGFRVAWGSSYRTARVLFSLLILCNTVITVGTYVPPYITGTGLYAIPGLYPFFDAHYAMKFFYLFIDQVGMYLCLMKSTVVDMFCVTLIVFHTAQLGHLKHMLRSLVADMTDPKLPASEVAAKEWIRCHQHVLELVGRAKEMCEPLLFVTYVFSLINMVESLFLFTLEAGRMDPFVKTFGLIVNAAAFASLGWLSSLIDNLEIEHESMVYEFDYAQVLESPKWMKSFCLITSARCRKPIKITALGFYRLSSKGFTEVVSASVSLMATMYQLRARLHE